MLPFHPRRRRASRVIAFHVIPGRSEAEGKGIQSPAPAADDPGTL
jgi:hypothetical protein